MPLQLVYVALLVCAPSAAVIVLFAETREVINDNVEQLLAATDVRSMVKVVALSVGRVLITGGVVAVAAVVTAVVTAGGVGHPPLPQVTPSTIVTVFVLVLALDSVVVRTHLLSPLPIPGSPHSVVWVVNSAAVVTCLTVEVFGVCVMVPLFELEVISGLVNLLSPPGPGVVNLLPPPGPGVVNLLSPSVPGVPDVVNLLPPPASDVVNLLSPSALVSVGKQFVADEMPLQLVIVALPSGNVEQTVVVTTTEIGRAHV